MSPIEFTVAYDSFSRRLPTELTRARLSVGNSHISLKIFPRKNCTQLGYLMHAEQMSVKKNITENCLTTAPVQCDPSCIFCRRRFDSLIHIQPMPYFLSTHLMHIQQMYIYALSHIQQMRIYSPNACPADVASSYLQPSCTFSRHHRKHRCMISIIRSCCSSVILLSLGKQSPRLKISAPTSIPEPFI